MIEFTCARPGALYLLLLIIPAVIISGVRYRKIAKNISFFTLKRESGSEMGRMKHFPIMMVSRSLFRCLAWIMLVLAYSGISWGTYLEPVQKYGSAVCFVFDISYSMNTPDAPGGMTRLKAAESYASMLLSHMPNSSVSVVLAKGDGVTVVPLTEDRAVVETLLGSLSPRLMSAAGTSLGKGVRTALKSFPETSGFANTIWVFTDGDETDGQLEGAVAESLRKGVPVSVIGFGSESESRVFAGDGKTAVYTALRSEKLKKICAGAMNRNNASENQNIFARYIDATEAGSALTLLDYIDRTGGTRSRSSSAAAGSDGIVTYEVKPVQRYQLFLGLAVMFYALGFFVTEIDPDRIASKFRKTSAAAVIFCLFFTSCSGHIEGARLILSSTGDWYQHKYNSAVAGFLQTAGDAEIEGDEMLAQYAVYNLATTYLMQNENDAALERYGQLPQTAPKELLYSSCYNTGIIAYKQGDYETAADWFRNALKADGSKVNAKINLEIAMGKAEKEAKARENVLSRATETEGVSTMESSVFQRIKENDMKQWKNSERPDAASSSADY